LEKLWKEPDMVNLDTILLAWRTVENHEKFSLDNRFSGTCMNTERVALEAEPNIWVWDLVFHMEEGA
jgi:hypothetical protein